MTSQVSSFARDAAPRARPGLLSALDAWIKRDLQAIFGDSVHEPIPAELHEIVRTAGSARYAAQQHGNERP
jgi:hypothetical protein